MERLAVSNQPFVDDVQEITGILQNGEALGSVLARKLFEYYAEAVRTANENAVVIAEARELAWRSYQALDLIFTKVDVTEEDKG